jgi:hypothetical protein
VTRLKYADLDVNHPINKLINLSDRVEYELLINRITEIIKKSNIKILTEKFPDTIVRLVKSSMTDSDLEFVRKIAVDVQTNQEILKKQEINNTINSGDQELYKKILVDLISDNNSTKTIESKVDNNMNIGDSLFKRDIKIDLDGENYPFTQVEKNLRIDNISDDINKEKKVKVSRYGEDQTFVSRDLEVEVEVDPNANNDSLKLIKVDLVTKQTKEAKKHINNEVISEDSTFFRDLSIEVLNQILEIEITTSVQNDVHSPDKIETYKNLNLSVTAKKDLEVSRDVKLDHLIEDSLFKRDVLISVNNEEKNINVINNIDFENITEDSTIHRDLAIDVEDTEEKTVNSNIENDVNTNDIEIFKDVKVSNLSDKSINVSKSLNNNFNIEDSTFSRGINVDVNTNDSTYLTKETSVTLNSSDIEIYKKIELDLTSSTINSKINLEQDVIINAEDSSFNRSINTDVFNKGETEITKEVHVTNIDGEVEIDKKIKVGIVGVNTKEDVLRNINYTVNQSSIPTNTNVGPIKLQYSGYNFFFPDYLFITSDDVTLTATAANTSGLSNDKLRWEVFETSIASVSDSETDNGASITISPLAKGATIIKVYLVDRPKIYNTFKVYVKENP